MILDRHAFAGLDREFSALQAALFKMQEHNLGLLAMLQQELKDNQQRYAEAKAFDKEINALEHQVDRVAAGIITKYTLVGPELRFTLSVFKVAYILECIADNMKNCIKRLSKLKASAPAELLASIREIAEATQWPLEHCLSILIEFDDTRFQELLEQKKTVGKPYRAALNVLQNIQESISAEDVAELHFIIRNVERISDLIADSAKMAYFIHTGEKYEKPV